jgi:adenine/guanine phosphoribosyltransferase-like PRPP-binding protein
MERREALFSPRFVIESGESSRWPKEGLVLVDDLFVTGWTLRSVQALLAREGVPVQAMITLLCREGQGEEREGDRN